MKIVPLIITTLLFLFLAVKTQAYGEIKVDFNSTIFLNTSAILGSLLMLGISLRKQLV